MRQNGYIKLDEFYNNEKQERLKLEAILKDERVRVFARPDQS
eukprot:SAG31_NODE_4763_length_2973_cov_1.655532_3_plen_42_part_00